MRLQPWLSYRRTPDSRADKDEINVTRTALSGRTAIVAGPGIGVSAIAGAPCGSAEHVADAVVRLCSDDSQ
ncbi:hypothetical protein [Nonomuraea sp. NPDC005650]|uniref:hypothetical protein n=1 Tax=Nonomuraea sp. NPDC005650 TaxID=3157045 RepID=UPI0033ABF1B9